MSKENRYDQPAPWIFKGKALYQLQLVPTSEARKHVPPSLSLVDFFGWTLGGFYLARYSDSPVGAFEELVVMGGLAWNPPTSCAWAARVLVSDKGARDHGLRHVGLPSRIASFSEVSDESDNRARGGSSGPRRTWWGQKNRGPAAVAAAATAGGRVPAISPSSAMDGLGTSVVVRNTESGARSSPGGAVCRIQLPWARGEGEPAGPEIKIRLPSFSGGTVDHPGLLQYACDLVTRVRFCPTVRVDFPSEDSQRASEKAGHSGSSAIAGSSQGGPECLRAVLSGKPLVCLAFDDFVMSVGEPVPLAVAERKRNKDKDRAMSGALAALTASQHGAKGKGSTGGGAFAWILA